MNRWKRTGIYILLALVLVVGFMLPSFAGSFQDAQTDQTEETVYAARVQLDMGSSLSVLQKLRIISERGSSVELDAAQTMEADEAFAQLISGLDELFSPEQEIPFNAYAFYEVSHSITLKMSGEDSLIYWEFWLADATGNQILADVDDDTGLILSLHYTMNLTDSGEEGEEHMIMPKMPVFLNQDISIDTATVFSTNGIFAGLEETGSSPESFIETFQQQYCGEYLRNRDIYYTWTTETSEPVDNSYMYSVMIVDNAGGYYVLPFVVTNNEISMN